MNLIIDFMLLAASGAACFFCWVLNSRLKSLTNTKDGLKNGIVALSQSAEDMQNAMSETKNLTGEQADRLQALLEEADKKIPELHDILKQLSEISAQTVSDTEDAAKNLIDLLAPHIREARVSAQLLLTALEETANNAPEAIANAEEPVESDASDKETDNLADDTTDLDGEDIEFVEIDLDEDIDDDDEVKGEAA